MSERKSFDDWMRERGWLKTDKADTIRTAPPMASSICYRRGPVRMEMSSDYISEHDFRVAYYVNFTKIWTLASVVTDPISRGQGFASRAVADFIDLCKYYGCEAVRLEACSMPAQGKRKMSDLQLRTWYVKLGFELLPGASRVMELKLMPRKETTS